MSETLDYLWSLPGAAAHQTGSRFICYPPVTDTDDDYVVLGGLDAYLKLIADGFVRTTQGNYTDLVGFVALRREEVNVIFTHSRDFFSKYVNATRLAKRLNLTDKKERIALFQAVLYGRFPQ